MPDSLNAADLWAREYEDSGIPSSFRVEPSGAVVDFANALADWKAGQCVADLGCGRGRNSLYLACRGYNVTSVDLVSGNIDGLQREAERRDLADRIRAKTVDLSRPWPFESAKFDVAIDTFVYKHQTRPGASGHYRRELARTLKNGAYLLLTLAGTDDGYYGPLLQSSPDPRRRVIIDPANGIESILYTESDIRQEFSDNFAVLKVVHKVNEGEMHGGKYVRSTYMFFLQRN